MTNRENGELLARAAEQFDALISMDKNMSTEHDISRYRIGLVLIRAFSNRIEALQPLVPAILRAYRRAVSRPVGVGSGGPSRPRPEPSRR